MKTYSTLCVLLAALPGAFAHSVSGDLLNVHHGASTWLAGLALGAMLMLRARATRK